MKNNEKFQILSVKLHDAQIKKIEHLIDSPIIIFYLDKNKKIYFKNVVHFRSDNFFNLKNLSSNNLYINYIEIKNDSWLIEEIKKQFKPNKEKKWGDNDTFFYRNHTLTHVNLYCNDWEFDVVCNDFNIE